MQYISLGTTGLRVSRLALGTAALGGARYGICNSSDCGPVDEDAALRLIHAAIESGINLFDTARAYGRSEALLGKGLAGSPSCVVATKISIPRISASDSSKLQQSIMSSLETSLRELKRDFLDIVQIHNATTAMLENRHVFATLEGAKHQGKLRFVGASVYGVENALAAIQCDGIDVVQVALNLLDQRMISSVIPQAKEKAIGVLVRSVFLKGVLTGRVKALPPAMHMLAAASDYARATLEDTWDSLPRTAVRFCLSVPGVDSVLLGLRSTAELPVALEAEATGPLPAGVMGKTRVVELRGEEMLDPTGWPTL